MKVYEKYCTVLSKIIKFSCPAALALSLLLSAVVYPAYSSVFAFPPINFALLAETLPIFVSVLCLCRLIMTAAGHRMSKMLTAELILCTLFFAAAYFFRNYGGFSVKGYIFSLAASLTAPYALCGCFFEKQKNKDVRRCRIVFLISGFLFFFLSAASAILSAAGSSLTAAIVIRLTALPVMLLTAFAACFGKHGGCIGWLSYISARLFSLVPALYILLTAADFSFAGSLRFVFPVSLSVFLLLSFFNALAIKKPSAFPRFFSL